ncbi:MAG TPA: DNA-formamidopyrimidine glycosylase family protein [Solirubrobacteraceae bacterium]|nr:DNA-formamidopyrimidine glycosylase family protein [Solirubrobacteraceae bacterium]
MTADPPLGRVVLRLVVVSLVVAGAAGCVALLHGELSDVDWKVIATSTLFALVSATTGAGLAARHRLPAPGWATAVLSLGAFVLVLVGMWPEVDEDAFWRATGIVAIGALEGAHASWSSPAGATTTRPARWRRRAPRWSRRRCRRRSASSRSPWTRPTTWTPSATRRRSASCSSSRSSPPRSPRCCAGSAATARSAATPQPQVADECGRLRRLARAARSARRRIRGGPLAVPCTGTRMPEGDTIHHAANRIRPVLAGRVPDEIVTPHPRFAKDGWPERLGGRAVEAVDAHGKHLFIRWEGGLVLHSHLRMTGWWGVFDEGQPWRRSPRRAWLRVRAAGRDVVQFDGPVLELMTASRARFDRQLAGLGPDVLAAEFDAERFVRRLREDDPTRPIGDALLDQSTIAGLGTIWRTEGCFAARLDPWRATGSVSDAEAMAVVEAVRPRMARSAELGFSPRDMRIYGKPGQPCPRCGARLQSSGQGENNRRTYWCPGCQT